MDCAGYETWRGDAGFEEVFGGGPHFEGCEGYAAGVVVDEVVGVVHVGGVDVGDGLGEDGEGIGESTSGDT